MSSSQACPDEPRLLAIAAGDRPSVGEDAHLIACATCRQRRERIRAELNLLRRDRGVAGRIPGTEDLSI